MTRVLERRVRCYFVARILSPRHAFHLKRSVCQEADFEQGKWDEVKQSAWQDAVDDASDLYPTAFVWNNAGSLFPLTEGKRGGSHGLAGSGDFGPF